MVFLSVGSDNDAILSKETLDWNLGGGGGLAPLMRDADLLLTFLSMLGRDLELPRKEMLEIELWRWVG